LAIRRGLKWEVTETENCLIEIAEINWIKGAKGKVYIAAKSKTKAWRFYSFSQVNQYKNHEHWKQRVIRKDNKSVLPGIKIANRNKHPTQEKIVIEAKNK
jgi:Holliday junction resolvase